MHSPQTRQAPRVMTSTDRDRVLVVIARTRHKMVTAELDEAVKRGAAFLELRLDFLAKAVDFKRLTPHKKTPWVATIRRPSDGGRFAGSEDERLAVLRQAVVAGCFEWIDLETDVAEKVRRFGPVKRIVSYHNTRETPADLESIYAKMLTQDADVFKIAVQANSPADVAAVLKLQRNAPRPTVAFCMGDLGIPTRYLALKYGAPWIYCAFNAERGIAPGLPTLTDFKTTYPVRSIDAETKIYCVAGDPVGHSYSPVLHNHTYLRLKYNALYLPYRIPAGKFAEGVSALADVPVSGYSVTIPHKQPAAEIAAESEPFVQLSGAANTLVRRDNGTFFAANTDHHAAVEALKAGLALAHTDAPPPELAQLNILILGAGGAARAIAHALHREGAHLTLSSRTHERSMKLAEEVQCKAVDWQARHSVPADVVINCTPVGMQPNVDESPLHASFLKPGLIVFDTVYTPETTLLVREAKSRGCHIITGVEMFVRQAARQVELFTGATPDLEKMRAVMRKALSPLTRALESADD
jgi:3-dehydroquinate dehydratase / shikimate dehydrogenase